MNIILVVAAVLMVGIIFLLNSKVFEKKDKRLSCLEALAGFLEAKLEPVPGAENSYQIRFRYKDRECVFEDIEDRLQKVFIYRVELKARTDSRLKIVFTEKSRTTMRANVQTVSDLVSPWTAGADKVILPPQLQEFTLFTNDSKKAAALFAKDDVVEILTRYKNVNSRGNQSMSLDVVDGVVTLSFHPAGELKPTWVDLQNNTSRIEDYLEELDTIARAIDAMKEK